MAKQNGSSQNSRRSSKRKSRKEEVNSSEEEKNDKSILEKIPLCEVITIKDDESDDEVLCDLKTENSKSKHASKRVKRQQDKKESVPVPGEPDGFGGLDQGATFVVEYAKTSRAACKRCDIRIKKGELRIGHRPLFRGKPGYQIFKHLECIVFSEDILCAEDVAGYEQLTDEDYVKLARRVHSSQDEIKKESQELEPDELVQKQFDGEIRETPKGFVGNLLPFQIEGLSWMYNQEVKMENVRGGILADEMGMGKTIQTIATILDNRPKLQRSTPGSKHPPCSDEERAKLIAEESLWDESLTQWKNEMKMNDVHPSILPVAKKDRVGGGARAGTLVICPVIALSQWKTEIEKFCESNALSVLVYHGPDRIKLAPRELLVKYDVVLTTYQVIEVDFRKMISPNRVKCPNCGNKFKIDKLPIHLKYFCGENAQRTDAQARTIRNSERGDNSRSRRSQGSDKKTDKKAEKKAMDEKIHFKRKTERKPKSETSKLSKFKREKSKRGAALKARKSLYFEDDSDDESSFSEFEVDSEDDEEETDVSSSDIDESPAIKRARIRQVKALKNAKASKGKNKAKMKKFKDEKKSFAKKKKDEPGDDDSDDSSDGSDYLDGIDMDTLIKEAMAGAQMSPLHSLCWWRVVLDEAHFIKSRSSQTSASAFSLTAIHRWCLSGTPLQNRVGEFYSLVRFLRLDPMAHYMCRGKDCTCKSIHYRMMNGKCKDCGHGSIQHYSHFNKHILNPIQRDGYAHDGRRAMFTLKNEILDKCLLRRTKETRAEDMNLPPRNVTIKAVRLHPVEEDFYNALYTQTTSSFNDYVADGTLLNNYAHIFDLLMRMRQAVAHPYLVIHSKKGVNQSSSAPMVSNGRIDCEICHEPPTERVISTCCNSCFCRSCVIEYTESFVGDTTNCPHCNDPLTIDLNDIHDDVVDDSTLTVKSEEMPKVSSVGLPSLKELPHVATASILRKIDLTKFATSTKIESLCAELVEMRRQSPGSKAIVFSQFVNMLDLIRWRLHSDPFLVDLGLGARAIHGGMDAKSRDEVLKDFRENPNVRVLLMSLKAGGVALNLTVANYIYIMDPWWNPAAEMQAIDRTHRLGQHRSIRAVRFIAENTVEERILQLQEKKRLVFDGTVGRDAGSLKMLTVDDMKSLFA